MFDSILRPLLQPLDDTRGRPLHYRAVAEFDAVERHYPDNREVDTTADDVDTKRLADLQVVLVGACFLNWHMFSI